MLQLTELKELRGQYTLLKKD